MEMGGSLLTSLPGKFQANEKTFLKQGGNIPWETIAEVAPHSERDREFRGRQNHGTMRHSMAYYILDYVVEVCTLCVHVNVCPCMWVLYKKKKNPTKRNKTQNRKDHQKSLVSSFTSISCTLPWCSLSGRGSLGSLWMRDMRWPCLKGSRDALVP